MSIEALSIFICFLSRQGLPSRILLRHLQPPVAEQAQSLRLQAPVDSNEPQRCGPHCRLQTRHQTGTMTKSRLHEHTPSCLLIWSLILCLTYRCILQMCVALKCFSVPLNSILRELLLQPEHQFLKPEIWLLIQ